MSRTIKASLLTLFFAVCATAMLVNAKLRGQIPPPTPHELFAIVNAQLTSVREADFQSAYRHAATAVQQKFTLAQFEKMVRNNYAVLGRVQRVEFGVVQTRAESALVQVYFFAPDDSVRSFLYSLTYEDSLWKIDGVEEVKGSRRAGGTLS